MINNKKVTAVLPAYNAAKTLRKTVADIPKDLVDEIILVDDASQDETVELSRGLGLITFQHLFNKGYGGNQKTCYTEALKRGADIVVMVHPDHQYDPTYCRQLLKLLVDEGCDAAFGSRMMVSGEALGGGMPVWKYFFNIFLTKLSNLVLGLNLTEYHSGFRAYSREVLEAVPFHLNSDKFVFDTQIIIQLVVLKKRIKEIPIPTKYFKEASSIGFRASLVYGLSILSELGQYLLVKYRLSRTPRYTLGD